MTNEWREARNQEELDALLNAHGKKLRVRVAGEWHGELCIRGHELHSLDMSGAHVRGAVDAAGARIWGELRACGTELGDSRIHPQMILEDAYIRGAVILDGAHIRDSLRADRVRIEGDLSAVGTRVGYAANLRGARIDGDVDAEHARVAGPLRLSTSHMRHLALDGAYIDGHIYLWAAHLRGALTYPDARTGDIEMPYAMHGVQGWAIAQHDGFVLWRDRSDRYYAGCRGPYTAEEALAHWGEHRMDERARVFRRAILARSREPIAA